MRTFIISDTHFGHRNIIEYTNRPFYSVEEMNETLIKNWNSVVKKDDVVWHLGDFGFGSKETIINIRSRLNGKIFLILGNHDSHPMKWYYECGFDKVYDKPVIINDFYILSHMPRVVGADIYGYIYGHVHNDEMYKDYTKNSFCACVERIDYKPILLDKIKEKMWRVQMEVEKYEKDC